MKPTPEDIKAMEEMSKLLDKSGNRPTPQMPIYGKPPKLSPKEKAARQKELDAKIKANQPAPKPAPTPAPKPIQKDMEQVKDTIQNKLSKSGNSEAAIKSAIEAARAKQLAPKTAPKPAPRSALPQPVSKPSSMPMEQVEINKQKAQAEMSAKQNYAPSPGVGKPTSPGMGGPMPDPGKGSNMQGFGMGAPMNSPAGPGTTAGNMAMKRGGSVRNKPAAKFSSGGSTSKASSRGDGIAKRGKTKGRYI